jgi:hypothetical protein
MVELYLKPTIYLHGLMLILLSARGIFPSTIRTVCLKIAVYWNVKFNRCFGSTRYFHLQGGGTGFPVILLRIYQIMRQHIPEHNNTVFRNEFFINLRQNVIRQERKP